MALRASPSQYHLVLRSASCSRPFTKIAQPSTGDPETSSQPASSAAEPAAQAPPGGASEECAAVSRAGRLTTSLRATMIVDMFFSQLEKDMAMDNHSHYNIHSRELTRSESSREEA